MMVRALRCLAILAVALCLALPALAADLGLPDLALLWIQGAYRAPLICEVHGVPRQALRSVIVHRVSRPDGTPASTLVFQNLDAPAGTQCHDVLGRSEPNVIGSLVLSLDAPSHPDTARHDFAETLRRDGYFTFDVLAGVLRTGPSDARPDALEPIDFRGGTARFGVVKPGSDDARRLAEFGPRRKLSLQLQTSDGKRLSFPLVQLGAP